MTKLLRYVVEPGALTLTFLLENGEEMIVPIRSNALLNQMSLDIFHTMYYADDDTGPTIAKIARTIDPTSDVILYGKSDVEENENVK